LCSFFIKINLKIRAIIIPKIYPNKISIGKCTPDATLDKPTIRATIKYINPILLCTK
jgi:hypothetical protein